ncbi:Transcription elongation factor [Hortaea werneckii]|nr:Transcription elongation factor [Hortaea werneckii]
MKFKLSRPPSDRPLDCAKDSPNYQGYRARSASRIKMSLRSLRACMICSIVQPQAKFSREGCPNCEEFLELRHNGDAIAEATSSVFEGLITLADPENSWVAKWQRLQGYAPGTYAVKVVGVLPEEVIAAAENAGIKYIPRDGSGEVEHHQNDSDDNLCPG